MNHPARLALMGSIRPAHRVTRRHRYGQAVARWIVALTIATAVAWWLSDLAVAALLDEQRLAALGIVP